jgi:FkbM family methyltransferase
MTISDSILALHDGVWWPASDVECRKAATRDCDAQVKALIQHVRGRDVIVQAGANVGLYPLALADRFRQVWTFEPDPTNWACLVENLRARDSLKRVVAQHCALGDAEGVCSPIEVAKHNCGAHRVAYGRGTVPVRTLDSLKLDRCDAIWLDVEGAEFAALRGAADTIERHSPVVAIEDKGLDHVFFGEDRGAAPRWLLDRGYELIAQIGRDKVFHRKN